jgi:uncharacterized membrane protein YdjX (TVP38/TMEM64 family)
MEFRFQPWLSWRRGTAGFVVPEGPGAQVSSRLLRFWLAGLLLAVLIIVPFLVFGQRVEADIDRFLVSRPAPEVVYFAVFALLMSDVVLPIPSSLVATAAGALMGFPLGFTAVLGGLIAGNLVGYALGRVLGRPALDHFCGTVVGPTLQTTDVSLVLTRAVPVLSEAATVVAGVARMPVWRFLLITGLANSGLAAAYVGLGTFAAGFESFILVFLASIIVPTMAYALRRVLVR